MPGLKEVDPRVVKVSFLLGDMLKNSHFETDYIFKAQAIRKREELEEMPNRDIDEKIEKADEMRLRRYENASWHLAVVNLASCSVWPQMGGKEWATGPVNRVAKKFQMDGAPENKVWAIKKSLHLSFSEIPLILFERNSNPLQFRIDDGCHRAVSYYLAGFRQAFAYAGHTDSELNLNWLWEGEIK